MNSGAPGAPDPRAATRQLLADALRADPQFVPHGELTHRVVEEVARSDAGVTLRVVDERLGRPALLKLVDMHPERVARFRREAALMARLDHPGVPPVYLAGNTTAGQPFLISRDVGSTTLATALADGVGRTTLLEALTKAVETVAYAHARGVIHRDLSPARILLGEFGEVFVVEWSAARDTRVGSSDDPAARLTQAGARFGTPGYRAPELERGDDAGPPADVFALGAILHLVLTGEPPDPAVPLPRRLPGVSPELLAILRKALADDPAARYAHAQPLAHDLSAALSGRRVEAYRYTALERLRRTARRRPVTAAALLTAALVLATALPLVARAGSQAGAAARAEQIRAARDDYAATATQTGSPLRTRLAALAAAQRWYGLAPQSAPAVATNSATMATAQMGPL